MTLNITGFQRTCHHCGESFHICTACDRWHWCCSEHCRVGARKASLRKASQAYRKSEKGRENSRKNQRAYRQRKLRQKSVSHHSPAPLAMPVNDSPQHFMEDHPNVDLSLPVQTKAPGCCRVCGRAIDFLLSHVGFIRRRPSRGGIKRCLPRKPRPR